MDHETIRCLKIEIRKKSISWSVRVPTRTLLQILKKFGWTYSEREEIQDLGQKTLFFTLKIETGQNCISRSVKGTNKNIIAQFDKIWLSMFQTGRDTSFGSKNDVFYLKNLSRKKCINRSVKGIKSTNKIIIANFEEIWLKMFQTGRDTSFG